LKGANLRLKWSTIPKAAERAGLSY